MNTLRRIPRVFIKTVAAAAVMVAVALPAAVIGTGVAGAATAPTLTCLTGFISCPNYVIAGQGSSGEIFIEGTGFANDQAVGGNVTLTTTATGVTFSNVVENNSTEATATISTSSSSPPGFYPVTLTDTNGSATMTIGLGIDVGPQVTTVAGNAATVGATTTVNITGTNLRTARVEFTGTGTPPHVTPANTYAINSLGTTMSFNVSTAGAAPGAFSMIVFDAYPFSLEGQFVSTYTVNSSATPVTITGVSPSELGIPVGPSSSNNLVTVSGTGFEAGAVVQIPSAPAGVSVVSSTFVNSSTMTAVVNVTDGAVASQASVQVVNPDTSNAIGTNILGIGEPGAAPGPSIPVPPVVTWISGSLTPGTSSIILVQGSSTFPITTGSTVKVTFDGITNPSENLTGTVLSVDSTNTATVRVIAPRLATSSTTSAVLAAATTLPVADTSGAPATGSVTIVDGSATQVVAYSAKSATSFTVTGMTAHPSGVLVEWNFPTTSDAVMSVNNGTLTEATAPVIVINAAGTATYTSTVTGSAVGTLQPGTYSLNAYVPGFGFVTGSTITFNEDNVTGTVAVVNGNTATLNVTVPAVRTVALTGMLAAAATPGQNALSLTSLNLTGGGTVQVGDKITVNADPFFLVPETFTVTSLPGGNVVGVSPAVADNHSVGATLSDANAAQSITDTPSAILTNGAGEAIVINPFFTFSGAETATPSLGSAVHPIGAGASSAPEDFLLSGAGTGDLTAANWSFTSSIAGASFTATSVPDAHDIDGTISIPPGTVPTASATFSLTDGLQTITGTLTTVAGPTITSVTAVGALTAGSMETVGIAGTNFVDLMTCATSDPAVPCAVLPGQVTDTGTIRTVTVGPVGAAALNGTDSISVTDPTTFGVGTLTTGFTVSGQPTYTSVSPTSITFGTHPTITVTGTLISASLPDCSAFKTDTLGNTTSAGGCTATPVSATSATISGYSTGVPIGDTITFTFGTATSVATTPGVLVVAVPSASFMFSSSFYPDGTLQAYTEQSIAQGSANVPFKFVGTGFFLGETFQPGTTLSIPASDGTLTITQVTPNAIFGTLNVLSASATGCVTATVTNPGGGSSTLGCAIFVEDAPTVNSVGGVTPPAVLNGTGTTLTITGTDFYPGAVVTSNIAGLATFGTATVTEGAGTCVPDYGGCNTLTVKVTPVGFTGNVPILDGLTITNPTGAGSVSVASAVSIDPTPVVTGTYNVPTFSTNLEVNITGSGFQAGMTATATNSPAYTVLLVNVNAAGTAATLLVTTTSAATVGTFSTVTFTNPDGGTVSFPLNGGPAALPQLHISGVHGRPARIGRTVTFTILGSNLGGASVTVSHRGVSVHKISNSSTIIKVKVTVRRGTKSGVAKLHVFNADGSAMVAFSIKK